MLLQIRRVIGMQNAGVRVDRYPSLGSKDSCFCRLVSEGGIGTRAADGYRIRTKACRGPALERSREGNDMQLDKYQQRQQKYPTRKFLRQGRGHNHIPFWYPSILQTSVYRAGEALTMFLPMPYGRKRPCSIVVTYKFQLL